MSTVTVSAANPAARERKTSYLQAIVQVLGEEMRRDASVYLLGQDIREALFGSTAGLVDEFGLERVRDVPISEEGFVGAAIGAAMTGLRPVVDMTIASFLYPAMDTIVQQAAKNRYLFGDSCKVPVVIRAAMFAGAGAEHTDRPYPMFMHVPGLKIAIPSTPSDVMGLYRTAIRDDDPVLVFEDQLLWGTRGSALADEAIPFGKAAVRRSGGDVTIVAMAHTVNHALAAAEELAGSGIDAEVIDPRTLVPLDEGAILDSVAKTGRLVIADPAWRTCGAAAEISAIVVEKGFSDLRAPILRVTTAQTHMGPTPEQWVDLYPTKEKIVAAVRETIGSAS